MFDKIQMTLMMKMSTSNRFMVKPQTSDIRMTYEYIGVTYGWHTSTYEWHADVIRVQTNDMWFERKIKLIFLKCFDVIFFSNIWFIKEFSACDVYFGLFTKIKKRSGISLWCTFSACFFSYKCSLFNTLSIEKVSMSYLFSFSRYQTKFVIKF